MNILTPPGWLIVYTAICYVVFFAFGGASIFTQEPGFEADGISEGSGIGVLATIGTFLGDLMEFITFDLTDVGITIPVFVRVFLFLTCTVPWLFVLIAALIEGIKALGGLIPFTMVLLAVLAAPGALGAEGAYASFQPDDSEGMWQVEDAVRICATEAPTTVATVTPPTASAFTVPGDSEDCFSFTLREEGLWSVAWNVTGPETRTINFTVHGPITTDWDFYINLAIAAAVLIVGAIYAFGWLFGFGVVAVLATAFPSIQATLGWSLGHTVVWLVLGLALQWKWEQSQ